MVPNDEISTLCYLLRKEKQSLQFIEENKSDFINAAIAIANNLYGVCFYHNHHLHLLCFLNERIEGAANALREGLNLENLLFAIKDLSDGADESKDIKPNWTSTVRIINDIFRTQNLDDFEKKYFDPQTFNGEPLGCAQTLVTNFIENLDDYCPDAVKEEISEWIETLAKNFKLDAKAIVKNTEVKIRSGSVALDSRRSSISSTNSSPLPF